MTEALSLVQVRLLGVPLRLRAEAQEHDQDLLRELVLVRVGAGHPDVAEVPAELLRLADELRSSYAAFSAGPNAEMESALDRGVEQLDVTYTVPSHTLSFIRRVRQALERVEDYCRDGRLLLTMAAPADVAAYRRWVFDEFERQMEGGVPVAWTEAASGPATPPASGPRGPGSPDEASGSGPKRSGG